MPFDPAGNFSLVPSYKAVPGQTIRTEQHNPPLEDIAQALSSVLVRDGRNGMVGDLNMGSFGIKNLRPGTDNTDAATVGQVLGSGPIGAVTMFAGPNAPSGWMLCAGQAISRTDFAACFAVLGTRYGAGDNSTTFNLPDLRGTIGVGLDNMGGTPANRVTSSGSGINGIILGSRGGAQNHVLSVDQLPPHTHPVSDPGHSHAGGANTSTPGVNYPGTGPNPFFAGNMQTSTSYTGITVQQTGSGQSHNNMPPVIILNYIIRVSA
ncbi:phage tail protein [Brucella sp. 22210]|uniref:phage tail protein n=1 Tax=Brucella sp. 22210 TaxID=3453892 RepID=UPI003F842EBA